MRVRSMYLAVGLTLGLAGAAEAATVAVVNGPVSVNKGSGFKSIRSSTGAQAGDLVLAGAGGTAEITYDDGCKQTVNAGETVTIEATSPCKLGALGADPMSTLVLGGLTAAAVVGGVVGISDNGASSP